MRHAPDNEKASPLVGEVGGGRPASAGQKSRAVDSLSAAPNPPHKGEGFRRLKLKAGAIARARALRKSLTEAEKVLWNALREKLPHGRWRHQVPMGAYYPDFCSHRLRLIIEVDGGQHAAQAGYDIERTRFLEAEGYRVLRFWNHDILANGDGVLTEIAAHIGTAP